MTEFQLWLTDTFNARLSNCCIQKYVLLLKYSVVQIIQYGFCARGKERNSDPSFHGNWSHIGIICTTIMLYCIGMVLQIFYSKQKGLNSWKSRRQLHRYIYIFQCSAIAKFIVWCKLHVRPPGHCQYLLLLVQEAEDFQRVLFLPSRTQGTLPSSLWNNLCY